MSVQLNTAVDPDSFIGKKFKLYYCNDSNTFQLDNIRYEVMEDENDGYRSCMDKVLVVDVNAPMKYFLADVIVVKDFGSDLRRSYSTHHEYYHIVDSYNHTWLTFGTDNSDDYYPCFIYNWYPKERVVKISNIINDL